jgi:conjugative transfer region lipoprotein (TIGR03751 family)
MLDKFVIAAQVPLMLDWTRAHSALTHTRVILFVVGVSLGACGTSPKNIIRQDGPTVLDIMRGTGGEVAQSDAQGTGPRDALPVVARRIGATSIGHMAYTRDAVNEVRQLFPTLPNPTIALYIHAHPVVDPNTGETLPVPAYTTAFPLYSRVEFAMPGELPPTRHPVAEPYPVARPHDDNVPFSDTRTYQ